MKGAPGKVSPMFLRYVRASLEGNRLTAQQIRDYELFLKTQDKSLMDETGHYLPRD